MGKEADLTVYDELHAEWGRPDLPVTKSEYYPMYCDIVDKVQRAQRGTSSKSDAEAADSRR